MENKTETNVTQREWLWVAAWSAGLLLLALLPALVVWATTPETHVFSGLLVNARDGHSYLAKMRQGLDGAWLFRLTYTAEPHDPILAYPLYLALGHLARLIPLPLIAYYIGARLVLGGLALGLGYRLMAELNAEVRVRRWMWLLYAAGGGLGLFATLAGQESVDLAPPIPEAFTWFSLHTNPHFPLVLALMILALLLVFAWPRLALGWRLAALIAVGVLLAITSPFSVVGLWPALGAGVLALGWKRLRAGDGEPWPWHAFVASVVVVGAMGVIGVYDVWQLQVNPALAAWSANNLTPSPPVMQYLLGFGLLLPLALVGVWRVWQSPSPLWWGLLAWLVVVVLLVYAPFSLQRRVLSGVQIPLGALGGLGVVWLIDRIKAGWLRALAVTGLGVGLFTTALFLPLVLSLAALQPELDRLTFMTRDEYAALEWLGDNATADDVVLAPAAFGNKAPVYSAARVVYGHPMEAFDPDAKLAWVEAYFDGTIATDDLLVLFESQGVTLVVLGARATDLPQGDGPDVTAFSPVYENETVTIYAVP